MSSFANSVGQHGSRFGCRQVEVRNNHRHAVTFRQLQPNSAAAPPRVDRARDDGAQDTGGDVVGMAFDPRGFVQNAMRFPAEAEQTSAMTTPAVSAAALDPSPLPRGMSFSISSRPAAASTRVSRATASAVCQIRLSSSAEMRLASRPVTRNA